MLPRPGLPTFLHTCEALPCCRFVVEKTVEENVHRLCQRRAAAMDLSAASGAPGAADPGTDAGCCPVLPACGAACVTATVSARLAGCRLAACYDCA